MTFSIFFKLLFWPTNSVQCKISLSLFIAIITSITGKGQSHGLLTTDETWHYGCQLKIYYSRSAFCKLLQNSSKESHLRSEESMSDKNCFKLRKLWESDSFSLNFKIISIHHTSSCCHQAFSTVQQCDDCGSESKVRMALTLYCSCPLASFHFHSCETFAVVSRCIHLSVQQMQSNCATVQIMSSYRRASTDFPTSVPIVTFVQSICETCVKGVS